jgi:hypothetical protein
LTPPKPHRFLRAILYILSVVVAALLIVLALIVFSLPANAHTNTQLSEWLDDWKARVAAQFPNPDPLLIEPLMVEYADMADRHPCRRIIGTWEGSCVPAAPPVHRGMGADVEQWRGLVSAYFPASQVERALCIMEKESGGNPNAKNPRSSASGLFQHLARFWGERSSAAGWGGSSIWNPEANIAVAAWLQRTGGWGHWSPYNRGLCR